jgi:cell division protein FtsN
MEKKKLLLVSVSVGAFLIIVIVASYLIVQPKSSPARSETGVEGNQGYEDAAARNAPPQQSALVDPIGMVRNPDGIKSLQERPEDFAVGDNNRGQDGTISIAPPKTAGVPEMAPAGKATARQELETNSRAPSQAPVAKPPVAKPVPQPQAARSVPVAAPDPKPRDYFWVQVGAFKQQSRAEELRKVLDAKGMKSIIDPKNVNGAIYFRVRIGPYVSKDEADFYWLPLIKAMGYEDSQVWQTALK